MKVGPTDGGAERRHGPGHHAASTATASPATSTSPAAKGADVALDGRAFDLPATAFCSAPASSTACSPTMRLAREEIFGPVLSVVRAGDLDEALAVGRQCDYGNGA